MTGPYWTAFHDRDLALIRPSPFMAAQLEKRGGDIPRDGPAWTWRDGGQVLAIAGYSRAGASEGMGWLLAAELTPRQWGRLIEYAPVILHRIRSWRTVRTLHALADNRIAGARRVLERLGFRPTGEYACRFEEIGADHLMTLELF